MQKSIEYIKQQLQGQYPDAEIRSFINLLLQKVTGFNRTQLIVNKNTIFSEEQTVLVQAFVEKLKKFVPLQYVLGETEFYGLQFQLTPDVLIPRPETEELIEWIAKLENQNSHISILDLGTGSGCIAISLKNIFENASVFATDISDNALRVAQLNGHILNLKVHFYQSDILKMQPEKNRWDVIVSNPPYIPVAEMKEMLANVVDYEPHTALFVPNEKPLLFYDAIAEYALNSLKPSGKLFFEIHRDFGTQCVEMLLSKGFSQVELKKDLSGNERMIKAEIC
jgi:release factor glutamine methyltransferase